MKNQKFTLRLLVLLVAVAMIFGETAVFTGMSIRTHAEETEELPLSDTDGDGYYEIGSAAEMLILEENFSVFYQKNLELTSDIDLRGTDFVQLGTSSTDFSGKLEGNGHTLTLGLSGKNNVALFYRIANGGVVRNLHLAGTVTATGSRAASLASDTRYMVEIINVLSTVDFILSADTKEHGGLVAFADKRKFAGTHLLHLKNSGFAGSFSGDVTASAGLVGGSNFPVLVENCFVSATAPDATELSTFAIGEQVEILGSYHTGTFGATTAGSVEITADDVRDGTLANLLGAGWGQTLGTDKTPVPGGDRIYASAPCASVFTNDPSAVGAVAHTAGEAPCDEWCSACYTFAARETAHTYEGGSPICTVCHAVTYIERTWDDVGERVISRRRAVTNPTPITADTLTLSDGWYVLAGDLTLEDRLQISGDVHLILTDGATLTANAGITVPRDNKLFVYGQEEDSGTLTATASGTSAAIGGENASSDATGKSGVMFFHGGNVIATLSGSGAAAIGGTYQNGAGAIRILGGNMHVTSSSSTAIGAAANSYYYGCDVRIFGGYVTASSGSMNSSAIGGESLSEADVFVFGGVVRATTPSTTQPPIGGAGRGGTVAGGLVIQNGVGSVLSDTVILSRGLTLGAGDRLVVPAGTTLTIPEGQSLENGGNLIIEEGGKVVILGQVANTGSIENAGVLENHGEIGAGKGSSITGNPFVGEGIITCLSHVYSGDCDPDCNQCQALREPTAGHTFAGVCDDECDVCAHIVVREVAHDWHNGFCDVCGTLMRVTANTDSVYEISNAGQLFRIAEEINRDIHDREHDLGFRACRILLTEDIDLENRPWTPIGKALTGSESYQVGFLGTLDGGGHEIRNLYVKATGDNAGLIGELRGGTVKNLTVRGVIEINSPAVSYVGTLATVCGEPDGEETRHSLVTGVHSYVDVTVAAGVTLDGAKYYGGLVGYVNHSPVIENSTWSGNISLGESRVDSVGGIVGRLDGVGGPLVRNCASYGSITSRGIVGGIVGSSDAFSQVECCVTDSPIVFGLATSSNIVRDVYYLSDRETDDIGGTIAIDADTLASGAIAYLFSTKWVGSVWGQKLGVDPYPVIGGAKIYPTVFCVGGFANVPETYKAHTYTTPCGDLCVDCGKTAPRTDAADHTYTDVCDVTCDVCLTHERIPPHDYVLSVCSLCGDFDEPVQDADGFYLIKDKNQLLWFAEFAREYVRTASARILSDIDLAGVMWEPIPYFHGTLDGGGHVIKNLSVDHLGTEAGLIGTLYGTVTRLGVENASVSLYCIDFGTTEVESFNAGVLVGSVVEGSLSDCFVRGEFSVGWEDPQGGITEPYVGVLCGRISAGGTVRNSYVTSDDLVGGVENGSVENSYCVTDRTEVAWGSAVTATDAASGRITLLLGDAFGQSLGTDALPAFRNETNAVYFGYTSCDVEAQPEMIYTNEEADEVRPAHTSDDDGDCTTEAVCSVCGEIAVAARDAHEAREDDGDCTTAVGCLHCAKVVVDAKEAHDLSPATLDAPATCRTCGKTVGDPLPPSPPPVIPEESTNGEEESGTDAAPPAEPDGSTDESDEGNDPSEEPTDAPSEPSESPSDDPYEPSEPSEPSESPSDDPYDPSEPSEVPSEPSDEPLESPSDAPAEDPSESPSDPASTPDAPDEGLPVGAAVAIAVGSVAALGGAGFGVWWFVIKKKKM